jgi:RNA polymerase sigma-70 factor, ECF subfamily
LNVFGPASHYWAIDRASFEVIYDRWFEEVARWLRALGGPDADVEDLAQEVFMVVRRKLDSFDGQNLPAWLYGIARRTLGDHRRRAWFKNLFVRRSDVALDELAQQSPSPADQVEQREARRLFAALVGRLSERRRRAFVLFEVEGYTADEIAALEGIPSATVRTRLHHARKDFMALVKRHRRKEEK